MLNLRNETIVITGGDGFLGRHVQTILHSRGISKDRIRVPLESDYDLTREADVVRNRCGVLM